jgi:hypothetical protein
MLWSLYMSLLFAAEKEFMNEKEEKPLFAQKIAK